MVGFKDNVASKKPMGRKSRQDKWNIRHKELVDNIDEELDDEHIDNAPMSPMRRIIHVAKEIKEKEEDFSDLTKEIQEAKDIGAHEEKPSKVPERKKVKDTFNKQENEKKNIQEIQEIQAVKEKIPEKPVEQRRKDFSESLKVREYLYNFDTNITDMKQKLIISQNDLSLIDKEINDHENFIRNEEGRHQKLYELYNFLKQQADEGENIEQTEEIIKNEIENMKIEIKDLRENINFAEAQMELLDKKTKETQSHLYNARRELKTLELNKKSKNDLREREKREFIYFIEETKNLEKKLFDIKIEYKKEKQMNNSLKSRYDQINQTLMDLKNILSI